GNTRFQLVPAGAEAGAPHQMGHQFDVACMCHGRILPLAVVSRGRTANAVRRLCLTDAIVMGVARERGCRRRGRSPSPRGNARTEMHLETADHHRADPNRAQSRILVHAASAPNRGDRTVRFPVVMAGSRVSLCSLGGTYSTALFAMMSTPEK